MPHRDVEVGAWTVIIEHRELVRRDGEVTGQVPVLFGTTCDEARQLHDVRQRHLRHRLQIVVALELIGAVRHRWRVAVEAQPQIVIVAHERVVLGEDAQPVCTGETGHRQLLGVRGPDRRGDDTAAVVQLDVEVTELVLELDARVDGRHGAERDPVIGAFTQCQLIRPGGGRARATLRRTADAVVAARVGEGQLDVELIVVVPRAAGTDHGEGVVRTHPGVGPGYRLRVVIGAALVQELSALVQQPQIDVADRVAEIDGARDRRARGHEDAVVVEVRRRAEQQIVICAGRDLDRGRR